MKSLRFLFTLILTTLVCSLGYSQVVINEVNPSTNSVELKNIGSATANVANYWLCSLAGGARYNQISNLTISSGDASSIAPGGLIVIEGHVLNAQDELGLYATNSFSSSAAIRDYVQWGQTNTGRSSVAEAAGLWDGSVGADEITGSQSLQYDGDGQTGTLGYSLADASLGSENICEFGTPDGGRVYTLDNEEVVIGVTGTDQLTFFVKTNSTADDLSYWYVITDGNDNILGWVNANDMRDSTQISVSGAPAGACRVWGWSYRGLDNPVMGENISTLDDNICEDLSENFIVTYREVPDGGMVTTVDGETNVIGIPGTDQLTFSVTTNTTARFLEYWYVITDADDTILGWVDASDMRDSTQISVSGAPAGACRVYGWSFNGLEAPTMGENISTLDDDPEEDLSDNFIVTYREVPDGGMVTTVDGETQVIGIPGTDQLTFSVTTNTTARFLEYWYVITDADDTILGWVDASDMRDSTQISVSGAPAGACRVYGWSFNGLEAPTMGENISTLDDDTEEDLSDNFIVTYREVPDGGMVTTVDGETQVIGIPGTDQLTFSVTTNTTARFLEYWYVITDADDTILGWVDASDMRDSTQISVSGAPAGACRVYGWSFNGLEAPTMGENISTLDDDAEEDLSDNFIVTYREVPDGGMVTTVDGETQVIGIPGTDQLTFYVTTNTTARFLEYWYVITDADDTILGWVDASDMRDSTQISVSGAPAGACRVYGWSFNGLEAPTMGENISTLADDAEEDLSDNFIVTYREVPDGGRVYLTTDTDSIAAPAGSDDLIFYVKNTSSANFLSYWYIITDGDDNILGWVNANEMRDSARIDLSGAPAGVCHVWGWSYRGLSDPVMGEHISTLNDDVEESISENWITAVRQLSTSIEDELSASIEVFPNPVVESIVIRGSEVSEVQLRSIDGKILFEMKQGETNLSDLAAGVYILEFVHRNGARNFRKILKN